GFPEDAEVFVVEANAGHDLDFAQIEINALASGPCGEGEDFGVGCRAGEIFDAGVGVVTPGDEILDGDLRRRAPAWRKPELPGAGDGDGIGERGNVELASVVVGGCENITAGLMQLAAD